MSVCLDSLCFVVEVVKVMVYSKQLHLYYEILIQPIMGHVLVSRVVELRPSHTTHETAENAIIFHTHCNFCS